jgi:hypothetical protein
LQKGFHVEVTFVLSENQKGKCVLIDLFLLIFYKIGRGGEVNSPISEKIEKYEEFSIIFNDDTMLNEKCLGGAVLFELLPFPSAFNLDKKNWFLDAVLSEMLHIQGEIIPYNFVFFGYDVLKYDLVYWLFVLSTKYEDEIIKRKICLILARFHEDCPLPKRMESILTSLLNLNPLSIKDSEEKLSAISCIICNEQKFNC